MASNRTMHLWKYNFFLKSEVSLAPQHFKFRVNGKKPLKSLKNVKNEMQTIFFFELG